MTHDKILEILEVIRPSAKFSLAGNTIDGLTWCDADQSKPTWEEILAGEEILAARAYRDQRQKAYPSFGDQLDALWKGGTAAEEMLAKILAVKAQFSKPE